VPFVDVRPEYGAVSTILAEYLVSAGVRITADVASALCYGISTETQDLGREASPADVAAMVRMFPLADQRLLGRLQHPRLRVSFFRELDGAIRAARTVADVIVCHLDALSSPDVPAEMADMLVSIEGVTWAMCTGPYGGRLHISVRTWDRRARAGRLLREVVGAESQAGGHNMIAGGSLELAEGVDADQVRRVLTRRFLEAIGRDPDAELTPLVPWAA
jgi:nanoRNase/pAp phosphatase (c-di-AMP/oligoRNAs hydrolase)